MAKEKETSKESTKANLFDYNEESIRSLDWKEHIRMRPGMYIGKLGDGSSPDDGIYVLVKEVIDNCIDEFAMGYGKTVELAVEGKQVTVRDYGRGIPLGKVVDVVSKVNTGAKFDSKVFQKSVGLNGVGTKAVNALSNYYLKNMDVAEKSAREAARALIGPSACAHRRGHRAPWCCSSRARCAARPFSRLLGGAKQAAIATRALLF